jgi:hypothetical protein
MGGKIIKSGSGPDTQYRVIASKTDSNARKRDQEMLGLSCNYSILGIWARAGFYNFATHALNPLFFI